MQYFGVPRCPYCKKRVNLIRTWSLKRQGEYRCPRCGGISNIFLSPLVYVFALLAVFCGGAVYFFHRFILDDVDLTTCLQVLIPFAVFFLLSLFMVYLAKPVIKKVPREEKGRKKRQAPAAPPPEPRPSRSRRPRNLPERSVRLLRPRYDGKALSADRIKACSIPPSVPRPPVHVLRRQERLEAYSRNPPRPASCRSHGRSRRRRCAAPDAASSQEAGSEHPQIPGLPSAARLPQLLRRARKCLLPPGLSP